MDNEGAIDLTHSWSVDGRTCHVDVRYYCFLHDLKEENNVIQVVWIPSDDNCSDIFTKNFGPTKV